MIKMVKSLTAKSTAVYMNLCKKAMGSVEELTTMLQDMTIKDTSVFTNLQSLQQALDTTQLKRWEVKSDESQITLNKYDNTAISGMYPARQLQIKHTMMPYASYRAATVPLPAQLMQKISHVQQILAILNYLEKLTPCQGLIAKQFQSEEVTDDYCEKETVEGCTIYRAQSCVKILKSGIRCEDCERLYTRLRVALSRKRKGGSKQPTNEELKVKIRRLRANLKYYKEKDKIKLTENDDKDMRKIFTEMDKQEEELNMDSKMKKLWEAQRLCVRGKQNRWDPE